MDNIYIDTSIFENNNFFESKRINELLKLSEEGHICIIIPELTFHEIKNRIKKNVIEAINKLNKNRNEVRILRNLPSLEGKFEKVSEADALTEFNKIVDERFAKTKIQIIPYPTINIKSIFNSYFHKKRPFSSGLKKDEFPDAFALLSLEEWCKENGTKCLIFSKDKDLLFYESERLEYIDYEIYLNDKLKQIEEEETHKRIKLISDSFKENRENFEQEIKSWLYQQLDDLPKYYDHVNYLEIHDIDVTEIEVELGDYTITSITDNAIYLQCIAKLNYEVNVKTDDEESGYYDGEDSVWHYFDTTTVEIKRERHIPIDFVYEIPLAGKDFAELEIDEINQGTELYI